MAESPTSTEVRTDAKGEYTAYLYADGHIETDPPNRPLSREDLQRQRLADFATTNALEAVEAAKAGRTGSSSSSVRQSRPAATLRALVPSFMEGMASVQLVPKTMTMTEAQRVELINSYDLGGRVVGPNAGARIEYG